MTTPNYEAQFQVLCAQHEGLRRPCGNRWWPPDPEQPPCLDTCVCQGRDWLPLLEGERVGALVKLCMHTLRWDVKFSFHWPDDGVDVELSKPCINHRPGAEAPGEWQALTAALTRAQALEKG